MKRQDYPGYSSKIRLKLGPETSKLRITGVPEEEVPQIIRDVKVSQNSGVKVITDLPIVCRVSFFTDANEPEYPYEAITTLERCSGN